MLCRGPFYSKAAKVSIGRTRTSVIHWDMSSIHTYRDLEVAKRHIGTLETVLYIEVVIRNTVEPLYKEHIGTLETVLCIEVVLNLEVIQWNLSHWDLGNCPLYRGCP